MKTRLVLLLILGVAITTGVSMIVAAQKKAMEPDLSKITDGKTWKLIGRTVRPSRDSSRPAIEFGEAPGQGMALLEGVEFNNGVIEVDLKGKDVLQRSFLGIVFRGVDDQNQDVVYFRPFNFKAEDPVRRIHAVQYVSHPAFPWKKLRDERNGQYEKAIFPKPETPAPDPNGWFHARIVVAKPKVSVYVNDSKEPSLVVDELSDRKGGKVGLWVGEGSGGTFANLKIVHSD